METNLSEYIEKWIEGIDSEIQFWSRWLKDKGGRWPEDYAYRMQVAPTFSLPQYLDSQSSWPLQVLDVGSGPISRVGIATEKGIIDLHACDPLALFYRQLFKEHNVFPYVLPEFAYAEALTDRYAPCSFDLVHMSNALDHSFMPLAGIMSMLEVVKVGGSVHLRHAENEAENQSYRDFHQWNISESNGRLDIWRQDYHLDLSEIESFADISTRRIKGNIDTIIAILTKKNDVPAQPKIFKNQFDAELLKKLATR